MEKQTKDYWRPLWKGLAIVNTTPVPNKLFDIEMRKMNDTELRIILAVTRATLGWRENKTGLRKTEDWITYYQLKQKTGRGYSAIAKAIDNLVKQEQLEARDEKGNILGSKNKRIGKKIFYRLGKRLLASAENEELKSLTSSESVITESVITESGAYKINTIQKKNITKELATPSVAGNKINELIELFKDVNPTYERLFANKTQRAALERLVKKFGYEKTENAVRALPAIISQKYAPRINTPFQLEAKLGELIAFIKQEKSINNKYQAGTAGN